MISYCYWKTMLDDFSQIVEKKRYLDRIVCDHFLILKNKATWMGDLVHFIFTEGPKLMLDPVIIVDRK